jgi:hypothetical protein
VSRGGPNIPLDALYIYTTHPLASTHYKIPKALEKNKQSQHTSTFVHNHQFAKEIPWE